MLSDNVPNATLPNLWSAIGAAASLLLLFIGMSAILCGLLWISGNAEFRSNPNPDHHYTPASFGGISTVPSQLEN